MLLVPLNLKEVVVLKECIHYILHHPVLCSGVNHFCCVLYILPQSRILAIRESSASQYSDNRSVQLGGCN